MLSQKIVQHIESKSGWIKHINLLGGKSGQILFCAYIYKEFGNDEYLNRLYELIDEGMEELQRQLTCDDFIDYTHGGGISGFLLTLSHLCERGIIGESFDDLIDEDIQKLVVGSLEADFLTENYDPLYGFIGKGIFLINRKEKAFAQAALNDIVDTLFSSKIIDKKSNFTWVDIRNADSLNKLDRTREVYDCGLAHGVAGIITFCCKAYDAIKSREKKETLKHIIERSTLWLLDQQREDGLFMFPYAKFNNPDDPANKPYSARLGWCYGDMAIAIAVYNASQLLNDVSFASKAQEIAINATKIDVFESGVIDGDGKSDPSFCHGACGISYLFLVLYEYFGDEELLRAYQKWKDYTERQLEQRIAQSDLFSELSPASEDYGLLYGYSGIGLTSLSYLSNATKPWSEVILL